MMSGGDNTRKNLNIIPPPILNMAQKTNEDEQFFPRKKEKPVRDIAQEQLEATKISNMHKYQNGEIGIHNASNCVVCHKEFSREKEKTNQTERVQCMCRTTTVHYECLQNHLNCLFEKGKRRLTCPGCGHTCARMENRLQKILSLLSNLLIYLIIINMISKLMLHWSLEVLAITYNIVDLISSCRSNHGKLKIKYLRKFGICMSFIVMNRVLMFLVFHYTDFTLMSCNAYEMDNIDVISSWARAHHSIVEDWEQLVMVRAKHVLYCSSVILSYHLFFEIAFKLYVFVLLHILMEVNDIFLAKNTIVIKKF